jgi:hypothetical protein
MSSFSTTVAKIVYQKEFEASYSLSGFRMKIREAISELEYQSIEEEWAKHVHSIALSEEIKHSEEWAKHVHFIALSEEIKHSAYHSALLSQTNINWSKVFEVVIENLVLSHSYLEHRIVAYKVGQKVSPKKVTINGELMQASPSTKLTVGGNIIQFLKVQGYLKNRIMKTEKKHTHNIVEGTDKFLAFIKEAGLYEASSKVRSGSCLYKTQPHSSEDAGGSYLTPRTMLDGGMLQSDSVCEALNKLQSVPYQLVDDAELVKLLEDYRVQDKWFDKNGVFMSKEWNKLISDIERFREETFYFPWAMDRRGRMYDGGSYIHVQGDSFQKAMLTIDGKKIYKWDCKNNNLQVYALLGRDEVLGSRVGLTDTVLEDLRIELANRLNEWIGSSNTFTKATVKHLVMINFYGGMEAQLMDNLSTIKDDPRYAGHKTIRDLIPDDKKEEAYDFIYGVLEELAPGAMKLMNLIYAFNKEDQVDYEWTMPDGFKVHVQPEDTVVYKGYYVDVKAKTTHSLSIEAKVPHNTKFNRSLAPNVIHSVDAYIGREVIRRATFPIMFIHDSFGVTEEYQEALINLVKEVMADVSEMDLLEKILRQINPTIEFRIKKGGLTRDMIMAGMPMSRD